MEEVYLHIIKHEEATIRGILMAMLHSSYCNDSRLFTLNLKKQKFSSFKKRGYNKTVIPFYEQAIILIKQKG